jgi:CelD/BcsL family acetyltransferase involved in cellulose biosynthesis
MTAHIEVELLHDQRRFAGIEREWWDLWRATPTATPFQSPAWLLPWWETFAPGELRVVAAWRHGRLIGLAPFYLETSGRGGHLLPLGISTSDYLDVLIDPDEQDDAVSAISRQLAAERWDCWELHELSVDAVGWHLAPPRGYDTVEDRSSICSVLALPQTTEGLASALPARIRRKIRMARHRADRCGGVKIEDPDSAGRPSLLSSLLRLHAQCWESRGGSAVLEDARVASFHRAAIARMPADMVRLYGLRIGRQMAAAFYGLQHRGRVYAYLSGFDPVFAHASPGTLILAHAIEQAVRDGARIFDFLRGGESFKSGWGAVQNRNGRRIFSRVSDHVCA